jgi:hypothetical protein
MSEAIWADFKTSPYFHQLREFEASCDLPARGLFWQMRTGKTKVVIDTACHLFAEGRRIEAVIVIAPNGVHANWLRRELGFHHWDSVPYEQVCWHTAVAGNTSGRETKASAEAREAWWQHATNMLATTDRLVWWAFNSESMTRDDVRKLIARLLRRRGGRVLVVFDECTDFRTPGSKRTQMARALKRKCNFRRILDASVVTNSPLHAFSQFELLEEGALGFDTYAEFRDTYAEYEEKRNNKGQKYTKLKGYRNLEDLRERMAKFSSVVLREDCEDLPDIIPLPRPIELTDEQVRLYRELHNQFTLDLNGREVSIGENTARLVKLQQIVSGYLRDEFGEVHEIPGPNPRLEAMADEMSLGHGKAIIWCAFHEDIRRVVARLTADGHKVVQYHGRMSTAAKLASEIAFRNDPDIHLVGQPKSGGRGLDFSEGDWMMWYSHTFDAIVREQGDERATEVGGKNILRVDLIAPGIDQYILGNVDDKLTVADAVARTGMKEVLRRLRI